MWRCRLQWQVNALGAIAILKFLIISYQGRIQDLKLGVAQMDWKIWKMGGGWVDGGQGWGMDIG